MVTLAQNYGLDYLEVQLVARMHNIPEVTLNGVVKSLAKSGLIATKDSSKLALIISPEKITIWQVIVCISKEEVLECGKSPFQRDRTSTVIMIRKEDEVIRDIISARLKRCKLSEWSKIASETVYI